MWIEIAGKRRRIVYDWAAIAALQAKLGADAEAGINAAATKIDLPVLADVLAIGLHRHHPEITAADIFAASPPISRTIGVIRKALFSSFIGEEAPAASGPRPPLAVRAWRAASSILRPGPEPTGRA